MQANRWVHMQRKIATLSGISVLALYLYGLSAVPALAYLDAGTGSMILQMLLGGFAGLAMVGKLYWHRILVMLRVRPDVPAVSEETVASRADMPNTDR